MTLHLADVSEHQGVIDWSAYAAHSPAAIARAHNGNRPDRTFPRNQAAMRAQLAVRGFYGYVVAGRDPAVQAKEFAEAVGQLQPGEFAACDLEEGTGDQSVRAETWCRVVDTLCGRGRGSTWVYSGEYFWHDQLTRVDPARPRWVAKYSNRPPALPFELWQHADNELHPGVGPCDCSIFAGDLAQLHELLDQGPAQQAPATTAWSLTVDVTEDQLRALIREETAAVVDARVRLLLHGDQPAPGHVDNHPNSLDALGGLLRRVVAAVKA